MTLPSYTGGTADWSLIPEHMVGAVRRYIEHGIEPGNFLASLLCNDLQGTFGAADSINGTRVRDYMVFLYNFAPTGCWGGPEKYLAWVERGGLGWEKE